MRLTGIALAIVGLLVMGITFLAIPAAPDELEILTQRIEQERRELAGDRLERPNPAAEANAAGWRENRQLGFIGGGALFLGGIVLFATGGRRRVEEASQA